MSTLCVASTQVRIMSLHAGQSNRTSQLRALAPIILVLVVLALQASAAERGKTAYGTIYSDSGVGEDGTLYGWGVTEVIWLGQFHTAQVSTSLKSPKGRTASSGRQSAANWVRADVSLPWDETDLGEYRVSSVHDAHCSYLGVIVRPTSMPQGEIDGARTPEGIPDDVAYRMFFLGIGEPEDATPQQNNRARMKISTLALDEEDANAFLLCVSRFLTETRRIEAEVEAIHKRNFFPHPDSTDWPILVDLLKKQEDLLALTLADLPLRLTEDGMAKVRERVQAAKQGMRRIPEPDKGRLLDAYRRVP